MQTLWNVRGLQPQDMHANIVECEGIPPVAFPPHTQHQQHQAVPPTPDERMESFPAPSHQREEEAFAVHRTNGGTRPFRLHAAPSVACTPPEAPARLARRLPLQYDNPAVEHALSPSAIAAPLRWVPTLIALVMR